MTDLWNEKVTIYNDVSLADDSNRVFNRFVIGKCQIQGGYVDKSSGTVRTVVNAKTVITKDIKSYLSPDLYFNLPQEERLSHYTASAGDYIVFGEVDDIVTNAKEFAELQIKYKDNGMKITTVDAYINGMAVDNITMTNA